MVVSGLERCDPSPPSIYAEEMAGGSLAIGQGLVKKCMETGFNYDMRDKTYLNKRSLAFGMVLQLNGHLLRLADSGTEDGV